MMMPRSFACLFLAAALAACSDDSGAADDPPPAAAADSAQPAPRTDELAADTGVAARPDDLSVVFERVRAGTYDVSGGTSASALELSVEDGHNVLYGPERVTVASGVFRTEVSMAPTERPTVYAYIAEPGGTRQWVVPIPLNQPRVAWSGASETNTGAGN